MITRRSVLRGMLGGAVVTLGLPWLEARAQSAGFPRRFGLFFWGNGVLPERWIPPSEGAGWTPSPLLEPLTDLRDRVTVVTGMQLGVPNNVPHFAGAAGILSGAPLIDPYGNETFSVPSVDQIIAAELGKTTRFKSLEFGADPGEGLSFNGPNSRNPPESSPHALFERVFGAGFRLPGDEPIVDPTLALRRSVLDAVNDDLRRLKASVSASDRQRLDQHAEGVRALEMRLAALEMDPPDLASCARPGEPLPDYPDVEGRPQLVAKNEAFCDLVALALACDQTRVFSNWFTYPVDNVLFPGATAGHHQLTHDEPGDQPEVFAITRQCVEGYATLLRALQRIPEGDETLLDHCAILGTSDISRGRTHSLDEFPILIGGSAGGKLRAGVHFRSVGAENAGKAILSIIRAVGVEAAGFGAESGEVRDGLSAIEG
jgi:hypothetical protein